MVIRARICKDLRRPGIDLKNGFRQWAGTSKRRVVLARQSGNRFLGTLIKRPTNTSSGWRFKSQRYWHVYCNMKGLFCIRAILQTIIPFQPLHTLVCGNIYSIYIYCFSIHWKRDRSLKKGFIYLNAFGESSIERMHLYFPWGNAYPKCFCKFVGSTLYLFIFRYLCVCKVNHIFTKLHNINILRNYIPLWDVPVVNEEKFLKVLSKKT
jgi:hypothetical protein